MKKVKLIFTYPSMSDHLVLKYYTKHVILLKIDATNLKTMHTIHTLGFIHNFLT